VEYQVAVLVRLITAARPENPEVAALDRSAYLILHEVQASPIPLSLQDLAERLKVDLSTISRQVSAMERKGLIERLTDQDDFRVHRVSATDSGVEAFHSMRRARHDLYKQILYDWDGQAVKTLAQELTRLNDSIRRYKRRRSQGS
jgi:DNA-binding MarR family transcriptional regulator